MAFSPETSNGSVACNVQTRRVRQLSDRLEICSCRPFETFQLPAEIVNISWYSNVYGTIGFLRRVFRAFNAFPEHDLPIRVQVSEKNEKEINSTGRRGGVGWVVGRLVKETALINGGKSRGTDFG